MWRDGWQKGWQKTRERLRLWLLEQELSDDTRHARGRRVEGPRLPVSAHVVMPDPSRTGVASPETAALPPVLAVPPEILQDVRPELLWEMTGPLSRAAQRMSLANHQGLVIAIDLADCQYSAHLTDALRETRAFWSPHWTLLRLRPGGRLNKAWLRQIQLGADVLHLTSLPLLLVLEPHPGGLRLKTLALDPMGPGKSLKKMQALLSGEPQLAPGTAQERLQVERLHDPARSLVLEQGNGFRGNGGRGDGGRGNGGRGDGWILTGLE